MSSVFDLPVPDSRAFGPAVERGGIELRLARDKAEMGALLRLRALCFRGSETASDADRHDSDSAHLWIARRGEPPMATLRLSHHADAASLMEGYSAGFFELTPLAKLPGTLLELGRLCLHPQAPAADVMRLIWTGIARMTLRRRAERLIGGTSLPGADPARHQAILTHLAARHLGPAANCPPAHRPGAFGFGHLAKAPLDTPPRLPPILRFYMSLGGWVSNQLATDPDLDTCILFTCVELSAMPAARRRLMHSLAAEPGDAAGA